jgi:hypothetical protein
VGAFRHRVLAFLHRPCLGLCQTLHLGGQDGALGLGGLECARLHRQTRHRGVALGKRLDEELLRVGALHELVTLLSELGDLLRLHLSLAQKTGLLPRPRVAVLRYGAQCLP